MASMPSTYKSIVNNLNICKTLTLEETVRTLQIKETKLNNLGIIKEKSANFAAWKSFHRGQGGWGKQGGARACTVSQTANGGYTIQGYSLHLIINCYHCKKDGRG